MYDVSKAEWTQMKARGVHRKYTVLDATDNTMESVEVPIREIKPMEQVEDIPTEEEFDLAFYKEELTALGEAFHPKTGLKKLKQKYENKIKEIANERSDG